MRKFVTNVVVIALLASFVQMVLPRGSVRRYANLVLGLVMVLALLEPCLMVFNLAGDTELLLRQAETAVAWSEAKLGSESFLQGNEEALLAVYEERLKEEIRALLVSRGTLLQSCSLDLERDGRAGDFGRILQIRVGCLPQGNAESLLVQPVMIGPESVKDKAAEGEIARKRRQEIEGILAQYFALDTEQIIVTLEGEE